jgi:hypothetical protein
MFNSILLLIILTYIVSATFSDYLIFHLFKKEVNSMKHSILPRKQPKHGSTVINAINRGLLVGKFHSRKKTRTTLVEQSGFFINLGKISIWQVPAFLPTAIIVNINWSKVQFWVDIFLPIILFYLSNKTW